MATKKDGFTTINLQNIVPVELRDAIKIQAIENKKDFHEWCIELLQIGYQFNNQLPIIKK